MKTNLLGGKLTARSPVVSPIFCKNPSPPSQKSKET